MRRPLILVVMHLNKEPSEIKNETASGHYRPLIRLIIQRGIILFIPCPIWAMFFSYLDGMTSNQIIVTGIIGLGFSWVGYYGLRLLPFLSAIVEEKPDGLYINHRDREVFYPWSSLSHATGNLAMQVMDIYSADGKRILSVDYMLTGFRNFKSGVALHIPFRA